MIRLYYALKRIFFFPLFFQFVNYRETVDDQMKKKSWNFSVRKYFLNQRISIGFSFYRIVVYLFAFVDASTSWRATFACFIIHERVTGDDWRQWHIHVVIQKGSERRRKHLARNSKCLSTRTKHSLCQPDTENGRMCVSWMAQRANGSKFANRRAARYILTTFNWNEMLGEAKNQTACRVSGRTHRQCSVCTYMLVRMHNEFNFKVVGFSLAQQQTNGCELKMSTSTHPVAHIRSLSISPKQVKFHKTHRTIHAPSKPPPTDEWKNRE